jgi:hypothetical protein
MMCAVESRPTEAALADVRRIYVDQLGGGKTSDQFRDMLISAIQSTGLFVLTENQEHADAALRGSGDDLIFTEDHNSSDSIGVHANAGSGSSSRALNSGASSNSTLGVGVTDSENSKIQERRHEATGSVRLVGKDGDVIWSTTQESNGGKFRSAMADVADKIVRQLADETRRMRDLAAAARDPRHQEFETHGSDPEAKSAAHSAKDSKDGGKDVPAAKR